MAEQYEYTPPQLHNLQGGGDLLDERYSVYYVDKIVGTAQLTIKGLYYHIVASCVLSDPDVYRLHAHSNAGTMDLGLLVPKDGRFTLSRSIPIKQFGTDALVFTIKDHRIDKTQFRVPLKLNQPFLYLTQLEQAKLSQICDDIYIVLPRPAPDQSDSSKETGQ